jgi:hypothetical protein
VKQQTVAALCGLSFGFVVGLPWTMALIGLALPACLLWVCIVEGPDPAAREASEWRGNWRQLLKGAEALRAQNNIRRGPRT